MKRCSIERMRGTLEIVNTLKKAGIEFVPIPVVSNEDRVDLVGKLGSRLENIHNEIENRGGVHKAS